MKGSDALGYSLAVAAAFLSASSALPPQYLREMKNPRLEGRPGSEFAPVNGDGRGGPLGPPVDAKFSTTEAQSADYPTDARPDQGQSAPSGPVPNAPAATPPAPPPSTPGQPAPKPAPEQPAPKPAPEQPAPKPAPEQPAPKPAPEQPAPKQPVPKPPAPAETGKGDDMACAKIQPEVEKFLKEHPKEQARIPAKMAYDCLQSVPNKVGPAQDMIRSLKAFVGWQSTLAFLKAPPRDYMLPPTDILGGLDDIADSAQKGQYKSEYEFQAAIVEHLVTAHDGHFSYRPDVFKAFTFRNKLIAKVASVSVDGAALPKLYHMEPLLKSINNSTGTASKGFPPAIVKINGQPAATLIESLNLKYSSFQDPDSQWNSQLPSYAAPDAAPVLAASRVYQGEKVTVTYEDGSEKSEQSFALLRRGVNFTGIKTGEDFYNKFCTPDSILSSPDNISFQVQKTNTSTNGTSPSTKKKPKVQPFIEGYPWPVIRDDGGNITHGYFLNGTGYDKVAVLALNAFAPDNDVQGSDYIKNYQDVIADFLVKCKDEGKTKLVVDVTGNGGGFVVAGYELFAQLFPEVKPFQANNLRLTDSLIDLARVSNNVLNGPNVTQRFKGGNERAAVSVLQNSEVTFNLMPGFVYTPEGHNMTEEQILAPVQIKGDKFTAYQSTPYNETSADFNLTGTGSRAPAPPPVFKPDDVVILTDGTCGSTCTIFSYLAIKQANVRSTVVGGRPQVGRMQSIAGVEGSQVFAMESLAAGARAVMTLAPKERARELRNGEMGILASAYALTRAATPGSAGSVNGKNAFSMDNAQLPLQFLYQPANCRVFHTRETVMSPAETWKRVVDATWTDPDRFCVEDSQVGLNETDGIGKKKEDPLFRLGTAGVARLGAPSLAVLVSAVVGVLLGLAVV
ncbi:peptidase S41 family protein [Pyricularia oryzae]|nr:peptidase S41 family protein [Pyricularia oryzae]KAI7926165.1 peptidase S41 family protein [Pyricularia oryzae]